METNCFSGGKRARDDAYELPAKKLKTDIKDKFKERESNIWNLVPSIVFELVTLLKSAKSEDETKSKQVGVTLLRETCVADYITFLFNIICARVLPALNIKCHCFEYLYKYCPRLLLIKFVQIRCKYFAL